LTCKNHVNRAAINQEFEAKLDENYYLNLQQLTKWKQARWMFFSQLTNEVQSNIRVIHVVTHTRTQVWVKGLMTRGTDAQYPGDSSL
jgi:hypothetical protein